MQAKSITGSPFWQKTPFKGFVIFAMILNLISVLGFLLLKNYLPPVVPVLYGRPSGEGQLLPTIGLLIAPALSTLFVVINSLVAGLSTGLFAKKLLIVTAFVLSLLTTITLFKIIFLVGFF